MGRYLCEYLSKDYEISQLGFGYDQRNKENSVELPYESMSILRQDMADPNKVSVAIDKFKPDVFFFSHDVWLFTSIRMVKNKYPHIKFICYATIDGLPVYYKFGEMFTAYDKVILPSEWSRQGLIDRWMTLNTDVVPYGIDHTLYHTPQQGKPQLKNQIEQGYRSAGQGNLMDLTNKFVALYLGANQDRTGLSSMYKAWKEFEKGKENQVTFLMFAHSASLVSEVGDYDLACFLDCKTLKIINGVQNPINCGQFMAASDVLFHLSAGEGWGKTVAEAMASGTVPVVHTYAAVGDYCNNTNSYPVPYETLTGGFMAERALSFNKDSVPVLNQAFEDWKTGKIESKRQAAIQTASQYTWERCAEGIKRNIDEVLTLDRETLYMAKIA